MQKCKLREKIHTTTDKLASSVTETFMLQYFDTHYSAKEKEKGLMHYHPHMECTHIVHFLIISDSMGKYSSSQVNLFTHVLEPVHYEAILINTYVKNTIDVTIYILTSTYDELQAALCTDSTHTHTHIHTVVLSWYSENISKKRLLNVM